MRRGRDFGSWMTRLAAAPKFQAWAARLPVLRRIARAEGQALFDLTAGFVHSQILMALVELDVFDTLKPGPQTPGVLARRNGVPAERMAILLQGGAALGLLRRYRDGRFSLSRRGAALTAVPGLAGMIRHHRVLYADLADPVAFLRGETDPGLARFWPYVFGAEAAGDPETAVRYSGLMAETQDMVAADTLAMVDLSGVRHLMDVGGGTGAFLAVAGTLYPKLGLTLLDLPVVVRNAADRMARAGLSGRATIVPGSFRDGPIPVGADAISLVRVLYDHSDATVMDLLKKVFAALPPGGRVVVSEPMSGGMRPDRATDTYFAFYTAAMGTGKTRSAREITEMMEEAGFSGAVVRPGYRSFVTSVVEASKPV